MGTRYLVDTNIAIYILKGGLSENVTAYLAPILSDGCMMSIISRIELLGFAFPEAADEAKAVKFVEESILLPLSDEVADLAIEIRKKHKTKLGDTLIAATAIVHNLSLLTRNDADFKNIEGLKVTNPFLV